MGKNAKRSSSAELIDENLKRVYNEAFEEELPDRFKDLLSQLRARTSIEGSKPTQESDK